MKAAYATAVVTGASTGIGRALAVALAADGVKVGVTARRKDLLDDLVSAKYLGSIPVDPITRAKDWHVDSEDVLLTPEQTSSGITDVHCSSDTISPFENTPYSSW